MSPSWGCGLPEAICTMPSRPKENAAQPITWRPDRAVVLGVAHRAPADEEQRERHEEADLADRALDDGAGRVHDRPGQLPPDRARRRRPRRRTGTARRRRGGARARGRGRCARCCGRPRRPRGRWPARRRRPAEQRGEEPGDRPRPAADRARRGRAGCAGPACASPCRWTSRQACASGWYSGIGCSRSATWSCGVLAWSWTCSCSATPAGKTYGSPWCPPYAAVTPVPCITGVRVLRPAEGLGAGVCRPRAREGRAEPTSAAPKEPLCAVPRRSSDRREPVSTVAALTLPGPPAQAASRSFDDARRDAPGSNDIIRTRSPTGRGSACASSTATSPAARATSSSSCGRRRARVAGLRRLSTAPGVRSTTATYQVHSCAGPAGQLAPSARTARCSRVPRSCVGSPSRPDQDPPAGAVELGRRPRRLVDQPGRPLHAVDPALTAPRAAGVTPGRVRPR